MEVSDEFEVDLLTRAESAARRICPQDAAKRIGVSIRTLEEWRRCWRQPGNNGQESARRGPPPIKIGKKRVLYEVGHVEHFRSYYKKWIDETANWKAAPEA